MPARPARSAQYSRCAWFRSTLLHRVNLPSAIMRSILLKRFLRHMFRDAVDIIEHVRPRKLYYYVFFFTIASAHKARIYLQLPRYIYYLSCNRQFIHSFIINYGFTQSDESSCPGSDKCHSKNDRSRFLPHIDVCRHYYLWRYQSRNLIGIPDFPRNLINI